MRRSDILLLHEFNGWANQRVLTKAAELTPEQLTRPTAFSWGSLQATLTHILDSEHVWRVICTENRYAGRLTDRQDFPTLASILAAWRDEEAAMGAFLDGLSDGDLDGVVRYEAEGRVKERVLWHCLVHRVNHGTQHRSECAAMLRELGHSPGSMDFTHFLNQRG